MSNNMISDLASIATLILFIFYFVGRIITIITVKGIWREKIIFNPTDEMKFDIVDLIGDNDSNKNPFHAFLLSTEGIKNIKIYKTNLSNFSEKIDKGELIYNRPFLNINQALEILIETGELLPTLIIEYETMDFMKVKLQWYDNLKNGVFSELVSPRNTLKSILYKLLR